MSKSIQIKDVPDDIHRVYRTRAAAAGQSLQAYLRQHLIDNAARPTMAEVLERVRSHKGGQLSLADATRHIRRERDSRG